MEENLKVKPAILILNKKGTAVTVAIYGTLDDDFT